MEMLRFHSRNSELKTVLKFLRKVLVFQKTYFKVKILKTLKIPGDYYIKTCQSLKRGPILKVPSTIFRGTYCPLLVLKQKPLRVSVLKP